MFFLGVCMLFLNIGMNAALRAPSAKNLLKIFGKEKAIIKASPIGPEPKKAAKITSLKKPNIRLIKVHRPTVIKLFKNYPKQSPKSTLEGSGRPFDGLGGFCTFSAFFRCHFGAHFGLLVVSKTSQQIHNKYCKNGGRKCIPK